MSKVEIRDLVERNIVEINVWANERPSKVLFEFLTKDKKDANVSFDGGISWIPLAVAHAAMFKFIDQFPFCLPQE